MGNNLPSSVGESGEVEKVLLEKTQHLHEGDRSKIHYILSFFDKIERDGALMHWVITLCRDDIHKMLLFEAAAREKKAVTALCQTAQAVGFENPNFEACRSVLSQYGHEGYIKLKTAQNACRGDWSRLPVFAQMMVEHGYPAFDFLVSLASVYGSDQQKFYQVAHALYKAIGGYGAEALSLLKKLKGSYGGDAFRFAALAEFMLEYSPEFAEFLGRLKFVYREDNEKFGKLRDSLAELYARHSTARDVLFDLRFYYGGDAQQFEAVLECVDRYSENGEIKAIEALGKAKSVFQKDPARFEFVVRLLDDYKYETCEALGGCIGNNAWSLEELQTAADHATSLEYVPKVINTFMDIMKREGLAAAEAYRDSLKEKAKGLVSSGIPYAHRASPDYMYYVKYAFPKGDYSTYELNMACGDRLEHLDQYQFCKEGYPVVLSGVIGHRVKNEETENMELLQAYDQRMENVRAFIAGRNPGNTELERDFETEVETMFDDQAEENFRNLPELTLNEKMVALFLSEAARREKAKSHNKDYRPSARVLDLALIYHYSHRQSIEHHAQRVERDIKAHGSPVSRNFYIWRELSVIYGENVKHVLQQEVLAQGEEATVSMKKLEPAFAELLQHDEKEELSKKQVRNAETLFANEHIPPDKKPDALRKHALAVFGANIKFSSRQEKDEFTDALDHILQECKGTNFSSAFFFERCVPQLFRLRKQFRLGIAQKLEELFLLDMHCINTEIAKYEELTEVELKEKQLFGPRTERVEKKTSPRNIRGFFTKTRETANARMGAYICIADDPVMWDDNDYFEFVMMDEDTGKCRGVVMLKTVHTAYGKFLFFGPNPFESLLDQVSSQQCYQYIFRTIAEFADENEFEGVIVPAEENRILGSCTNRGGDFPGYIKESRIKGRRGQIQTVTFPHHFTLGYYHNQAFTYKHGALVWSRDNPQKRMYWAG